MYVLLASRWNKLQVESPAEQTNGKRLVASGTENVDHFGNEVGTWIKSKRGHRPSPRAISNLDELRSLLLLNRRNFWREYPVVFGGGPRKSRAFVFTSIIRLTPTNRSLRLYVTTTREIGNPAVEEQTTIMESSRGALVILLLFGLIIKESMGDTRYFVKVRRNSTDPFESNGGLRRAGQEDANGSGISVSRAASHARKSGSNFHVDDDTMIRESLKANEERRNSFVESSTFDPDVLNKFLDEYANKIKSTTDRGDDNPFRVKIPQGLDDDKTTNGDATSSTEYDPGTSNGTENVLNSTLESTGMNVEELNDTDKRNKYYGSNPNDEKNGWVTLEAIPWSKSKISKWQANTNPQRPWPEMKLWNKPNTEKPWDTNRPSRPAYVNNEPWNNGPIYQSGRPQTRPVAPSRPSTSTRPSYFGDRFDSNPNQAQKWPPERPASSWEKFPSSDSYRPNSDIITDDRPSNFPNTWNKYSQISNNNKPTYSNYDNNRDRFTSNSNMNNYNANKYIQQDDLHDWHDNNNNYPPKDSPPSFGRPGGDDDLDQDHLNRPHQQSHYQFGMDHPQSHPSTGEGQWVLLSTNRGYSKSRQRSLKLDTVNDTSQIRVKNDMSITRPSMVKDEDDGTIAVMTSKRQVRLTVLPSLNGTNTTTSHGGLLEVERTFKTVDQSQKEYEASKNDVKIPTSLKRRPIRTIAGRPSNSAVLAAVGAGMLPATMAMMIPMILGRKKRSNNFIEPHVVLPYEFDEDSTNFYRRSQRRRKELAFEERV